MDAGLCRLKDLERINTNANRMIKALENSNEGLKREKVDLEIKLKRAEELNKRKEEMIHSLKKEKDALAYISTSTA